MIGNLAYINHKVYRNKECPIKDFNKIETINEMYWKEFKNLINNSNLPVIEVKHIGLFYVNNGNLRRYVRLLITIIRKIRKSQAFKKGFDQQVAIEKDMVLKLRSSWSQLDNLRYVYIARKTRYEKNKIHNPTQERDI